MLILMKYMRWGCVTEYVRRRRVTGYVKRRSKYCTAEGEAIGVSIEKLVTGVGAFIIQLEHT